MVMDGKRCQIQGEKQSEVFFFWVDKSSAILTKCPAGSGGGGGGVGVVNRSCGTVK